MNRWNLLRLICIPLVLALVVSSVVVNPALADDSLPPTETPTEALPPVEEVAPLAEQTVPPEETTPAEAVESLPEGTTIAVVDEQGETVPLATQEAADAIDIVDPIWCPVGVKPITDMGGCSHTYSSLQDLVFGLLDGSAGVAPKANGIIWIETGLLNNDNTWVVLDGLFDSTLNGADDFGVMENYSLTLQGGWNGVSGSTLLNTPDPYSYFTNMSLSILNWKGAVTINNIIFNTLPGEGTDNPTLNIQSTKAITLNNIHINGNEGSETSPGSGIYIGGQGARLDTKAAPALSPAAITVTNSSFTNNYGTGLYIQADGAVTLKTVVAVNNGGDPALNDYGVYIENWISSNNLNQPVTISGSNQFVGNKGTGLAIHSSGAVTLNNITAYGNIDPDDNGSGAGNDGYGLLIVNNHDASASNVKMTGTNLFNGNQVNGLNILTNGTITLNSVTAEFNGNSFNDAAGAVLNTCLDGGSGCTTSAKSVVLTGINNFSNNQDSGLSVVASGVISIAGLTASYNGNDGASLDNCRFNLFTPTGISCKVLTAQAVTLSGSNMFIGNTGDGLHIVSTGVVTTNNVTANDNEGDGVDIVNNVNLAKVAAVAVKGVNIFNGNGTGILGNGLVINSYGAVTLYSLTANNNLDTGVLVDNRGYNGAESKLTTRANVILYGVNRFDNNAGNGLEIQTAGTITVNNIYANGNDDDGTLLSNGFAWKPGAVLVAKVYAAPITLAGLGYFDGNGNDGLQIISKGAVTLTNVTSKFNGNNGVDINSHGESTVAQKVTLSGTNLFIGNGFTSTTGSGLLVAADLVAASNITANGNQKDGAYFDVFNTGLLDKYLGVTITGFNFFQNNSGDGLRIDTQGSITLSHVDAYDNGSVGIYAHADRNVTLSCGMAYSNNRGLDIEAGGSTDPGIGIITLKGVQSWVNVVADSITPGGPTLLVRTPSCP
jgi:hypothetical protein